MELLAQRGVERTVDIAIDERPKAWRQIGGLQAQWRIVQVTQADKFDKLAAHASVKELGHAAHCFGKARVHRARGGLHALAFDLLGIARKHQVVLVERRCVGHKGAAPALGSNQALVNKHLKGMAHGAARQARFVHEFHLGRQFISAGVGAGGNAVAKRCRQTLVLGQILF